MVTAMEDIPPADMVIPATAADSMDSALDAAWDGEEEGEAAEGAGGKLRVKGARATFYFPFFNKPF
jgi:hypothetical protein